MLVQTVKTAEMRAIQGVVSTPIGAYLDVRDLGKTITNVALSKPLKRRRYKQDAKGAALPTGAYINVRD